jgi:hypothetical protein
MYPASDSQTAVVHVRLVELVDMLQRAVVGMASLRCLVWPDIPLEALSELQSHFPHVPVVTSSSHPQLQHTSRQRLPLSADPSVPLDLPFLHAVAQFDIGAAAERGVAKQSASLALGSAAGQQADAAPASGRLELSLADRFR